MDLSAIIILGVGLSMDAFAAALVKGLCSKEKHLRLALKVGLYFGFFQGFMVWIGYTLGLSFSSLIDSFDHWIAFVLLLAIGGKMIYEGFQPKDLSCEVDPGTDVKAMITISIATSIDALAVGISLALLKHRNHQHRFDHCGSHVWVVLHRSTTWKTLGCPTGQHG